MLVSDLRVLDKFAKPDDFSNRLLYGADSPLMTVNSIVCFRGRKFLQMINNVVHFGGPPTYTALPVLPDLQFLNTISGRKWQPRIAYGVQLARIAHLAMNPN